MRKYLAAILFISVLSSCGNREQTGNADPTIRIPYDSATRVRTERDLNPYAMVDISPMDMSYYPVDYPKLKMSNLTTEPPVARVVYSRPHLGGRVLFRDILRYDTTWRLGANESTEIEFYRNVSIQDQPITKGRYILYCVPGKENWELILNANIDTWGLHADPSKDVARFTVPVTGTSRHIEYFTMVFERSPGGANLVMAWDNVEARLPIGF